MIQGLSMLTKIVPQPVEMEVGGKVLKFAQLRIGEIAKIQAWLDSLPNPLDQIRPLIEGLAPDERKALLMEAQKELRSWPPQYGTKRGLELIGRPEGTKMFMRSALKRCQHNMTDLECDEITNSLEMDQLADIIEIASTGKLLPPSVDPVEDEKKD
jgi:hypothetical protein